MQKAWELGSKKKSHLCLLNAGDFIVIISFNRQHSLSPYHVTNPLNVYNNSSYYTHSISKGKWGFKKPTTCWRLQVSKWRVWSQRVWSGFKHWVWISSPVGCWILNATSVLDTPSTSDGSSREALEHTSVAVLGGCTAERNLRWGFWVLLCSPETGYRRRPPGGVGTQNADVLKEAGCSNAALLALCCTRL